MYSELYTAASGMVTQLAQMDRLTNNLANVSTIGFKAEETVLEERPIATSMGWDPPSSHVAPLARWIDFSPGAIHPTGEPLDLALEGEGFFMVEIPEGIRLTRDGRFSLDADGRLVLRGMPVLGTGGEIYLRQDPVGIQEDGRIIQRGVEVGRLRVVRVSAPQGLERWGEGLFGVPEEVAIEDIETPKIRQGHVEMSNANPIRIMVQMIDVLRNFEMQQRLIQTVDRLGERAVQGLARRA